MVSNYMDILSENWHSEQLGLYAWRVDYPGVQYGTCVVVYAAVFLAFLCVYSQVLWKQWRYQHIFAKGGMITPKHSMGLEVFVLNYNQREELFMGVTFRDKAQSFRMI